MALTTACLLSPCLGHAQEKVTTRRIAKVFGQAHEWDRRAGIRVVNNGPGRIVGTDLGAMTLYQGKLWFNLGDTHIEGEGLDPGKEMNFLVACSSQKSGFADGIRIDGFLNSTDRPRTALAPRPAYPIPNAMFTVRERGREHMFAHYMEVAEVEGHDHHIFVSRIARYEDKPGIFRPYKPEVYRWTGAGAPEAHFHFGMASFRVDVRDGFVYMLGSPSGRFGGVKLARIPLASFVAPEEARPWEYFVGRAGWSPPTLDERIINQAVWLIPPKDQKWSLARNYDRLSRDAQEPLITIAEFCLVYNPHLEHFLLITGRPAPATAGGGVWYYTAPKITGPWSREKLLMPNSTDGGLKWTFYGTYTTDALLQDGGRLMYFVATTWEPYGVYLYEATFLRGPAPSR